MILAGFILLAVGVLDLLRRFVPRPARWYAIGAAAVAVLVVGGLGRALIEAVLALGAGTLWLISMPLERRSRFSFWPAVLLAIVCAGAVAFLPARVESGVFGAGWRTNGALGEISFDLVILAVGAFAVLLETGNVIVRAALRGEQVLPEADELAPVSTDADAPAEAPAPTAAPEGFRGGRLIGPLERMIVLLLTLASAYPLLAAMLAAKGIVRFPEISRDGASGARAEYFLVGSLVSWVVALGAAFLVWWGSSV